MVTMYRTGTVSAKIDEVECTRVTATRVYFMQDDYKGNPKETWRQMDSEFAHFHKSRKAAIVFLKKGTTRHIKELKERLAYQENVLKELEAMRW